MRRIFHAAVVIGSASRSSIARIVAPRAATKHSLSAIWLSPSRSIDRCALIVRVPAVRDPLCHPTSKVVKPQRVRRETAHRRWLTCIVSVAAAFTVRHLRNEFIAPPVAAAGSGTGRIFPFGFTGKAIVLPRTLGQPCNVLLRVSPTQIAGRSHRVAVQKRRTGIRSHAVVPLAGRHWVSPQCERFDPDCMSRSFGWILATPHPETASRQTH